MQTIFMKRLATGLLLLAGFPFLVFPQQEYKGTVSLIPKGPDFNAAYYTNKLSMKVDAGGTAVLTANLRFGPRSEPGDYISFTGNISGTLQGGELSLSGSLNQAMQDGKRFIEEAVTTRVTGQKEGDKITGTFYMRYNGEETSTMTFTLNAGELAPELLFPLGKSPKVFDKGWLFGASFKITGKNNEEVDLTDKIEWSGTASFEPDKGASSRPVFNTVGENKIILTAAYEGKKYSKEYKVQTVNSSVYARVGSKSFCPGDSHGTPADPLVCMGPVITGNGNVLIDGMPVACEGDRGIHAACGGPNNFVIVDGDPEVLINGKKVAKLGSRTRHCGGGGYIASIDESTGSTNLLKGLSGDISITKNGRKIPNNSTPEKGTTLKTGPKGLLMMSPDRNTVLMVMPNTGAVITGADGNDLVIQMNDGALFVNGEKGGDNKNLVIESINEKLLRKGTRFLFSHNKDSSRLIVYEGEVEVQLKKENKNFIVPAGKVYFNDFKNSYTITDTLRFQSSGVLSSMPKDSTYWQLPKDRVAKEGTVTRQPAGFLELVKKYWYFAAGGVLLILLMVFMSKRKKA
jgi:uncharacterized Zn-binding protein involved in type VI secretion